MADGLFEVFLVRAPKNLTEITECIHAIQTQNYNNCQMITFGPASKILVTAEPDMPWTLDGEREEGHSCVDAENLHHAIRLMKRVD